MLYPLECYDPSDSKVDKPTIISETENDNGRDEDNNMNDDVSEDDLLENSTSRPTRKETIAAREKFKEGLVLKTILGSVADHTRGDLMNYYAKGDHMNLRQ